MNIPPIGILPVKAWRGMNDVSDHSVVKALTVLSYEEAFATRFQTDAHFCTYFPFDQGVPQTGAGWPRCNKIFLPKMRGMGLDLRTQLLVLDYDNPGHLPWDNKSMPVFLNQLALLADKWPLAWQWNLMYTTRNGARLVYLLDKPIPVDVAEQNHQWLCLEFRSRGMMIDNGVSDWTRVFRLPWVVRDAVPTWANPSAPAVEFIKQSANVIAADDLGLANPGFTRVNEVPAANINVEIFHLPQPQEDDAHSLLHLIRDGRMSPTQWFSLAKRRLQGRECYDCIFEGKALAERGSRDSTLMKHVGQCISLLGSMPQTTPAHIYGLLLDVVKPLDTDAGTPNWPAALWGKVLSVWAKQEAKQAGILVAQEHNDLTQDAVLKSIAKGMMKWCSHPLLPYIDSDDPTERSAVENWIMRRLIASTGQTYCLMTPSGYYDEIEVTHRQLIIRWRMLGLDVLSPSHVLKENGSGFRDVSGDQLIAQHGFVVRDVIGRVAIDGTTIDKIGTDSPTLVIPLFRRSPELEVAASGGKGYNADVDQWLQAFFGENYIEGVEWIRWALAFEAGPIAALSIQGAQGAGKKMLVQGLVECLDRPRLATGKDIVGKHQYGLMMSPFLNVDEGWPDGINSKARADTFRSLVGGDPIYVEPKFRAPLLINNPIRVIFTANNMNLISGLTGNRDLSPDDREALFVRILHYNIGNTASNWLRARGGVSFTAKQGHRWLAGDSGQPSDYIVAKHFLHLYLTRTEAPGKRDRLLVQGGRNPEIMFDMRTNSGRSPVVIETIFKMLDSPSVKDGLTVEEGNVYVTSSGILDFYRNNSREMGGDSLSMQNVASVLKGLMIDEPAQGGMVLQSRKSLGKKRWHKLDLDLLANVSQRDGHHCRALSKINEGSYHQFTPSGDGTPVTDGGNRILKYLTKSND